jgi:hypothetical protein
MVMQEWGGNGNSLVKGRTGEGRNFVATGRVKEIIFSCGR